MEHQSAVYLDALGANIALSAKGEQGWMRLAAVVHHHSYDPAWLAAMRELIDALVESEGDNGHGTPSGGDRDAYCQSGE